jgi:hypothetical protein
MQAELHSEQNASSVTNTDDAEAEQLRNEIRNLEAEAGETEQEESLYMVMELTGANPFGEPDDDESEQLPLGGLIDVNDPLIRLQPPLPSTDPPPLRRVTSPTRPVRPMSGRIPFRPTRPLSHGGESVRRSSSSSSSNNPFGGGGMVRVFDRKFTLEDAIGHACSA